MVPTPLLVTPALIEFRDVEAGSGAVQRSALLRVKVRAGMDACMLRRRPAARVTIPSPIPQQNTDGRRSHSVRLRPPATARFAARGALQHTQRLAPGMEALLEVRPAAWQQLHGSMRRPTHMAPGAFRGPPATTPPPL